VRTTGRLFAVVDDASQAPGIIEELGRTGIRPNDVTILRGAEGAARIDARGVAEGIHGRLRQALSFTLVDQMPDFVVYEAAVLNGRTVLAVPIVSDKAKVEVLKVLRSYGAHFINYYGRFATEEHDLWRGPELDIPGYLRR
jgi:hypothetical protein